MGCFLKNSKELQKIDKEVKRDNLVKEELLILTLNHLNRNICRI